MRNVLLVVAVLIAGCGGGEGEGERAGEAAVYERIETSEDCAALQAEFDQAMTNAEAREPGDELRRVSLDYADAAHERMGEVGCYE